MVHPTIYLSFPSEQRDHGVALGGLMTGLGYTYTEGSASTRPSANRHNILVRLRMGESDLDPDMVADTQAFLAGRQFAADDRIIDVVATPGIAVWPEHERCPIAVVDAVAQTYQDWVGNFRQALAGFTDVVVDANAAGNDDRDDDGSEFDAYEDDYDDYDEHDYDDYDE